MKSRINFLVMILAPITTLFILNKIEALSSGLLVALMVSYALIYHPIVSYFRLKSIDKLRNTSFLKFYLSFWSLTYFEELYLTK